MPATPQTCPRLRFAIAPAMFLLVVVALAANGQQPDPKKGPDPKTKDSPIVKLPDGTFLWVGNSSDSNGERVSLTPQELTKLIDQLDQMRKQLAARKPAPPSGCAVRGRVEKRGEQLIAILKLTCTFRTTAPQTAIALGGRRGFLVAATLDGNKLPVLDTTEDGFALMVESAGDHTLLLDLEAPITARGAKPELGFEIGLPRAAITTLLFDPPGPDVKRVNLTTKTVDPTQPAKPPDIRRTPAMELKQLASRPGQEAGAPLGPVDSLEVTWDPPATAAQPADQVQSAELDVSVLLTEGVVETTAKIRFRGPAREWKLVAPVNADLSVDRASSTDVGPTQPAVVTKPGDPNKPMWKIEIPAGTVAADWVVTAVTRQLREKADDPKYRGPFSVGPFTTLDVLRQTGLIRVTAGANTHFTFKHGPDLRKAEPPGPGEDDVTTAFFRITTGPTGPTPVNAPMFTVEARAQTGAVKVKPTYRLSLTETGWRVRAEVRVFPIRTEVEAVTVEVPADWRGLEASPPELVEGVQQRVSNDGFWAGAAARFAGGKRVPVVVRLAAKHKQPFDLILTATVPVEPGDTMGVVPLPRFPDAVEAGASISATVPEGFEVRGETRDWDGEYAAWGVPLTPSSEGGGRSTRAVTSLVGKTDDGVARVTLRWNPHRPDLTAEVHADVTLGDRLMGNETATGRVLIQTVISQQIKLRGSTDLPRQIRFRGPTAPAALKSTPPLEPAGPGEWVLNVAPDTKELSLTVSFATTIQRPTPNETTQTKVPVVILWPTGATQAETTVRVWSNMDTGHSVTTSSGGWREMPVEPATDREALPALTLVASGFEPLVLETRPTTDTGVVAVWADRGLVQAWGTDDGTVSYRARFLLRRWLRPTVELRLPTPLAGPNPEFLRDGQRVEALPILGGEEKAYRIPLPPARIGATTVIEVRYQLPISRGRAGELLYHPATLPSVAFAGPVRWQVTVPHGSTPLLTAGATAEFRWRPRPLGISPVAGNSSASLDWWFSTGEEVGDDTDASVEGFTARQMTPGSLTVYRVSHIGMVVVCSIAAFILLLLLWRLPSSVFGLSVACVGAAAVVTAMFYPHPAAQVVGSCQPGLAAAVVVLFVLSVARWWYHRRVTRMPGFSRTSPEPSRPMVLLPSSTRRPPIANGSPIPAPAATAPVAPIEG